MEKDEDQNKILLPHHVQQKLCDTRLPYRQGRKLTAVKVYSIARESNHLLIFGVPSLNLRKETKAMFMKFGKLLQFNISKDHIAESFTETYHAQYERIQSARKAKRMLDTRNYYGGSLHVCYAPEMESVNETQQKILQRQSDVINRLRKLQNEEKDIKSKAVSNNVNLSTDGCNKNDKDLLNMGEINVIGPGNQIRKNKRKVKNDIRIEKRFKPCFIDKSSDESIVDNVSVGIGETSVSSNVKRTLSDVTEVEIVDCTSVDNTIITNSDELLNYDKFGDEVIFKLPSKPVNKIMFNVSKTSLVYAVFYLKPFYK